MCAYHSDRRHSIKKSQDNTPTTIVKITPKNQTKNEKSNCICARVGTIGEEPTKDQRGYISCTSPISSPPFSSSFSFACVRVFDSAYKPHTHTHFQRSTPSSVLLLYPFRPSLSLSLVCLNVTITNVPPHLSLSLFLSFPVSSLLFFPPSSPPFSLSFLFPLFNFSPPSSAVLSVTSLFYFSTLLLFCLSFFFIPSTHKHTHTWRPLPPAP